MRGLRKIHYRRKFRSGGGSRCISRKASLRRHRKISRRFK